MLRFRSLVLAALLAGCAAEAPPCPDCLVLRDVTVIDGRGSAPVPHQTLLLRDGRIAAIGAVDTVAVPPEAEMLDLSGRFVMPGLIDMHAHVTILPMEAGGRLASRMDSAASAEVLRTLLAFGITTLRNPAAPAEDGVALREAVASGTLLGPTIRTAGNTLNRGGSITGPSVPTPTEAAVRAEVQRQAFLGVDYIKVYSSLPPDLVAAAIDEAHAQGLEVIGHLQRTTWTEGSSAGIDHLTHGAPWSAAYLPEASQAGYRGTLKDRLTWLERVDFDGPAMQTMLQVMVDSGVTLDPTLIASRTKFLGDDPHYLANPDSIYAPPLIRSIWQRGTFTSDWTASDYARGHAVWPRVLDLTKRFYDAGILLTAGSDLPNPGVIPGVSLHEELQLLHDAGIPSLAVLQIATYNGAVALRLDEEIGSIEVGKEADLVILAADPVADLANTRAIEAVVLDGRVFYPASLRVVEEDDRMRSSEQRLAP